MKLTRRDLLRVSAASGAGLLLPRCGDRSVFVPPGDAGMDATTSDAPRPDGSTADASPPDASADTGPVDGGTIRTRVVIIGSGFGGAVAALRLAQARIPSVVLERGKRWTLNLAVPRNNVFARILGADRRSTWMSERTVLPFGPVTPISRYVGVLERVQGNGMAMYAGAGVGGGSLVYGGFAVTPREMPFTRAWGTRLSYDEMINTYIPRARMMMRATPIPADVLAHPAFNSERIFLQHAMRAGVPTAQVDLTVDWDVIRREIAGTVERSTLDGEVIYGNNNGCKLSLDRTYLADAEATGMTQVLPLHQVRDITQDAMGIYQVLVDRIDETGNVLETKTFACDYLFLAAGTYGTNNLLLKAKAKNLLPRLDDNVGRNFGNNGNAMFMRWGLSDATGPQQASFGGQAMADFDNPISPALVEHAQFPAGVECNCLLHLGMTLDVGVGTFRYDAARDAAVLDWPKGAGATSVAAMQNLADRLNTANGGMLNGSAPSVSVTVNGILSDFTYHPLGGMVLNDATDNFGRVNNYRRLYVIDGSLLPRSAGGVNPALTITALAERNIERIVREDFA